MSTMTDAVNRAVSKLIVSNIGRPYLVIPSFLPIRLNHEFDFGRLEHEAYWFGEIHSEENEPWSALGTIIYRGIRGVTEVIANSAKGVKDPIVFTAPLPRVHAGAVESGFIYPNDGITYRWVYDYDPTTMMDRFHVGLVYCVTERGKLS